jgi:cytochrome P450 / NADPH-cytochrome P450 reductase
LDGKFQALPPNSWKPFGNGLRACIGRGFAEQEMLINTAMILQRFNPEMVDPQYELEMKSTLTVKPTGFYIRVKRRPGRSLLVGIPGGSMAASSAQKQQADEEKGKKVASATAAQGKINIFYGGNSGTCECTLDSKVTMLTM